VDAFWLVIVALLWGATNPFLKRGGEGIEKIKKDGVIQQFLAEVFFLAFNWKYMLPFVLNQSGSVLFYLTLASVDITLAVPITNSLTFICTGISGKLIGEKFGNKETYLGIVLVLAGIATCVLAKS
ncbi:transmembrane protein 234, partial [Lamellibrachia satsuma]